MPQIYLRYEDTSSHRILVTKYLCRVRILSGSPKGDTIGDTDPREAGSASGSLSAVQQLANAIGAAAVTTVYFHASTAGATTMSAGLAVVATVILACCGLVWLMPRKAPAHHP
jgi:hypothetical protein